MLRSAQGRSVRGRTRWWTRRGVTGSGVLFKAALSLAKRIRAQSAGGASGRTPSQGPSTSSAGSIPALALSSTRRRACKRRSRRPSPACPTHQRSQLSLEECSSHIGAAGRLDRTHQAHATITAGLPSLFHAPEQHTNQIGRGTHQDKIGILPGRVAPLSGTASIAPSPILARPFTLHYTRFPPFFRFPRLFSDFFLCEQSRRGSGIEVESFPPAEGSKSNLPPLKMALSQFSICFQDPEKRENVTSERQRRRPAGRGAPQREHGAGLPPVSSQVF